MVKVRHQVTETNQSAKFNVYIENLKVVEDWRFEKNTNFWQEFLYGKAEHENYKYNII